MVIDAQTESKIKEHQLTGTVGFVSWRRLKEVFRAANELRDTETLVSYSIDDRGIEYKVVSFQSVSGA